MVLEHDLSASKSVYSAIVSGGSEAYKVGASEVLEATVDGAPGRYAVFAGVRSLASQQIAAANAEPATGGLIGSLDAVAKSVDPAAAPFPARSEAAVAAYVSALQSANPATRIQQLRTAIAQAPDFGPAYLELIAADAQSGLPGLDADIAAAQHNRGRFQNLDRARLDALLARVRVLPLSQQAAAFAAVVALAPNDLDALSTLARDQFLLGNAPAAERSLQRAIALRGITPALQSELIYGLVATRQFAQAQALLAKQEHTPANLLERAACLLLAGDLAGADALADQSFAGDPLATLRRAEWLAAKGDVSGAVSALTASRTSEPNAVALAQAQAAIWYLQLGRRAEARQAATVSAHAAASDATKEIASAVFLLIASDSGSALRMRLDQAQAKGQGRAALVAYGLFLYADYAAAAGAWNTLYRTSGEADLQSRIMLAAAYRRMNRSADLAALRVQPVLPNLTGADPFATVVFGELRRLLNR